MFSQDYLRAATIFARSSLVEALLAGDTDNEESTSGEEGEEAGGGTLEDAARREQEYLRERLRKELGREPSEAELSEWLRRHTEGY